LLPGGQDRGEHEQEVRRLVDEAHISQPERCWTSCRGCEQKAPAMITNLKELAGRPNKDFLAAMAASQASLQLFIRIMRNFTEIRENVAAAGSHT
jgi:hypothetical protein